MSAVKFYILISFYSVPEALLRTKFSKSCQLLLSVLGKHAVDGGNSLLKSVSKKI